MSLTRILIANRGEIACRIIKTAREKGYGTVAIYSDADAGSRHVRLAGQAVRVGPAEVGQSYLNVEAILQAVASSGADAVHPGYGFLSENADFARRVTEAGVTWVGPDPAAIEAMGSKASAKALMRAAGVPCVPGFDADDPSDEALINAAAQVGYPLLVKASAGGGGRGMRRVDGPEQLGEALVSARRESVAAFGSGALLLERLVEGARHVEVQVLGDQHGHVVHLGERDCSVQRRHQKVIEEAPCPVVDSELRQRMGEAACRAAAAVNYAGAGTVEFLLEPGGSFFFLEMNTRLQVEHPVTEMVTGLDLVSLQLDIAEGAPLPFSQEQISLTGHAIEARLYAEDPAASYAPQAGELVRFEAAELVGLRTDHGLNERQTISPHYDPMLGKIIAVGPDRQTARRRLLAAMAATTALGIRTNRAFIGRVLADPDFAAGAVDIDFLSDRPHLCERPAPSPRVVALAVGLWVRRFGGDGFRSAHPLRQPVDLLIDGAVIPTLLQGSAGALQVCVGDETMAIEVSRHGAGPARIGGRTLVYRAEFDGDELLISTAEGDYRVALVDPTPRQTIAAGDGQIRAPSAGTVLSVAVAPGQEVAVGDPICTVEAMKIETTIRADVSGSVESVFIEAGRSVSAGMILAHILVSEPT